MSSPNSESLDLEEAHSVNFRHRDVTTADLDILGVIGPERERFLVVEWFFRHRGET